MVSKLRTSKGRQANHPKQTSRQPILQVDFTYITSFGDKFPTPILTAIDIQTGMAMAAMITVKHSSATRRPVYKHSSLSVAGQKAFYKATMRST